jgi:hypothetical protein
VMCAETEVPVVTASCSDDAAAVEGAHLHTIH